MYPGVYAVAQQITFYREMVKAVGLTAWADLNPRLAERTAQHSRGTELRMHWLKDWRIIVRPQVQA
jgi:hypothetical protein